MLTGGFKTVWVIECFFVFLDGYFYTRKMNSNKFNHFLYGFIPGLLLPIGFMWLYLNRFYPNDLPFSEIIKQIFPGVLMGKILLLSVIPNLLLVFIFYKQDNFKVATGIMIGAMPYLIPSFFMI